MFLSNDNLERNIINWRSIGALPSQSILERDILSRNHIGAFSHEEHIVSLLSTEVLEKIILNWKPYESFSIF